MKKKEKKKVSGKKLAIILIVVWSLVFVTKYHASELKQGIQTLINNTFAYASEKTSDLESFISNGNLISDSDVSSLEDSGITGEDYVSNAEYYPYYEFLSDNEKALYKQIYANIEAIETKFIPVTTVSDTEITNAMIAVYNDHPELFWLNTSYSYKYTKSGKIVQIILSFNDTVSNIEEAKEKFETSANKIIEDANKLSSNYLKEKYVHDAIIKMTSYNLNASMNQSAYSALVNGSSVCAGYSRAFQYIMIKLGIPTYYVVGDANGNHAWNIVKLDDGYYNVDVTWDDTSPISYTYFNLTDSNFANTHTRTGSSLLLPSCTKTTYQGLEISAATKVTRSNTITDNTTTTNTSDDDTTTSTNKANSTENGDTTTSEDEATTSSSDENQALSDDANSSDSETNNYTDNSSNTDSEKAENTNSESNSETANKDNSKENNTTTNDKDNENTKRP